jgi:hypothetical protein
MRGDFSQAIGSFPLDHSILSFTMEYLPFSREDMCSFLRRVQKEGDGWSAGVACFEWHEE